MRNQGFPPKQGLYDPQFEHDACGIGFIVNVKGIKSHQIVSQALKMLGNLTHRGGFGSEENTGDGAGILMQIPHRFFQKAATELNFKLPEPGSYGVGMVFLSPDEKRRQYCEDRIAQIVQEEGQILLGWRWAPIDPSSLGATALKCMPAIRQLFIGKSPDLRDNQAFERKLYIIRKRVEKELHSPEADSIFYIASLSSKTIVYKGMLTAEQVELFYQDLRDPALESALALVHSRYSTNTFPSWERAHPYRYIIHNGEINTLRGNINWMNARQHALTSELFGADLEKTFPIIDPNGSDSANFDNCLEFLTLAGRSLAHAAMLMIPEPWQNHESMGDAKRAFYEYNSSLMEPWDGPAAVAFTDGSKVGALLDRNGLRPARYYVTKDDLVILASEAGVLDVPPEDIKTKDRLHPGRMLLIDTEDGRIISDDEIKSQMAKEHPYQEWLASYQLSIEDLPQTSEVKQVQGDELFEKQQAFGYTYEALRLLLASMALDGVEPTGAMGNDSPLAVLSDKPQLLYNYFKQLFAQVTNPAIDAIREELIIGTEMLLGSQGSLLETKPENCRQIKLPTPFLTSEEMARIQHLQLPGLHSKTLDMLFRASEGESGLENGLKDLYQKADEAITQGATILILSDKNISQENAAIPALLAVGGLHHHLIRQGNRTKVSIIVESGEPLEVHHFALLLGYGASAIFPYLAYDSIRELIREGILQGISEDKALRNYIKALVKGVIKVLSKMGISTIQSYQGAQIFEAVGIGPEVIDKYFTRTPSRIGGIGLETIAHETLSRHRAAFSTNKSEHELETGGVFQWRKDGERHLYNPETIYKLQSAAKNNDYDQYKEYAALINEQTRQPYTLRGLLQFKAGNEPIPLGEVEPIEAICRRFKTGAMSYGSISQEAHECLAIAMNRIGGKSNTGEGGEDPARFVPEANGDSKCSAIKQVASGRFGVTSEYLVNAKEIQIKIAQGAKPGEGGQLPGRKVYPWIAKVRYSTPGVGLISPPPHHDIYSIEDLAELIHDLKNANPEARISVKLVSEVGVGTIAAGVAKGRADVILISGYDGGTGASPRTSIRHAGLPWELGLAETHQTLVLNNLRSRVTLEADGKLMTGRDVVIAALLGAEEFGFATAPLVVLGCVMMRVCNLDTCPVGIATQNPELRKRFCGDPAYVVNFMRFVAQEVREILAELGFRTVDELIGRTDLLEPVKDHSNLKVKDLDFAQILYQPDMPPEVGRYCQVQQDHGIEKSLDQRVLVQLSKPALEERKPVKAILPIHNTNRVVGTLLGSELTKGFGSQGLPDDTISLHFKGSAGQSFGAFLPPGITLTLEGDANDYLGKGLSGGKIILYPPARSSFVPEENVITGNVAFYGATGGEAYINGAAGERFCVRNSGLKVVVEAVGDHGLEYMTGGRVVVLGPTGRNFAAGMSGGIAYIFDETGDFPDRCNIDMVYLEELLAQDEVQEVRLMIQRHVDYTGSRRGKYILTRWNSLLSKVVKVMPKDYKRVLTTLTRVNHTGLSSEEAVMLAFEENKKDLSRVSGN